ncbi:MAG: protein kinase, partial [Planctomycetaceae bacterium]|nr:protein kinase [Planctomycetaceae bacterium]
MGTVYRATHKHLGKQVAIKLLSTRWAGSPTALARFEREMKAVGKLDHPHVVQALDAGLSDGQCFLIMEYLVGSDVGQLVAGNRRLTVSDACEIVRQAAIGLDYAQQQGLVHRDVKPSNLFLAETHSGEAVIKVMDLGLAANTNESARIPLTDSGQLMGTLEYMAPEQADADQIADQRADVYSLGATLFRLLAGRVPFSGPEFHTPARRLCALISKSPPSIAEFCPELPAGLIELVDEMLQRDPALRPKSLNDIANKLQAYASGNNLNGLLESIKHPSPREQNESRIGPKAPGVPDLSGETQPVSRLGKTQDENPQAVRPGLGLEPRGNPPIRSRFGWRTVLLATLILSVVTLPAVAWYHLTNGATVTLQSASEAVFPVELTQQGDVVQTMVVGPKQKSTWLRAGQYELRVPTAEMNLAIPKLQKIVVRRGVGQTWTMESPAQLAIAETDSQPQDSLPPPPPVTILVQNSSNDGTGSLRDAIAQVAEGGTIRFDESLNGGVITLTSGELVIDKSLAIDASSLGEPLTLTAGGLARVLRCEAGHDISLSHLIITGGYAHGGMGGKGGGIFSESNMRLSQVYIVDNHATDNGGGIKIEGAGRIHLVDCEVAHNSAPNGAGLYCNSDYEIRNCTFAANVADGDGGGIFQVSSDGILVNSTFTENRAVRGSAILVTKAGNVVLRHGTIVNNSSSTPLPASALQVDLGSRFDLENSIVSANGSPQSLDIGVFPGNSQVSTSGLNLIGNIQSDFGHTLDEENLIRSSGDFMIPKLATLGDYGGHVRTMPPLSGARVIDAARPSRSPVLLDARGLHRPIDGDFDGQSQPDLGAVEFSPQRRSDPIPFTPIASGIPRDRSSRPLKIDLHVLRNEGLPVTVQHSACVIVPFVSYVSPSLPAKDLLAGRDEWKRILEEHGDEFDLPAWVLDPRWKPLPSIGPSQKPQSLEVDGSNWCAGNFNNATSVVHVYDDPETPEHNEMLDVRFFFWSHFQTANSKADYFEFRKYVEFDPADLAPLKAEWTRRELNTCSQYHPQFNSTGVRCGTAFLMFYLTIEFSE